MKKNILKNNGFQTLLASLICIVVGIFIGFLVLLMIEPSGAYDAIMSIVKNFLNYSRANLQIKNLGKTLVKTAPLLMCSLSILFSYKVGLFNIGAAGQYVVGACASLYAAIAWQLPWLPCLLFAFVAAAAFGAIVGALKAYFNVNEVISGIMLNWIALYVTNMILTEVKAASNPYTRVLAEANRSSVLPTVGLDKVFGLQYVSIAIPLSVVFAIAVWVILNKTKFGYELRATGLNKNAAKYCGMAENRNIILSLAISGALAGLGAAFLYLTDIEQWKCTVSAVPQMGFNGIAAAFLGGLSPVGTIFASFFIQHITEGGTQVDMTMYCSQISDLLSAIIIYLCGFTAFLKIAMNKGIAKFESKHTKERSTK